MTLDLELAYLRVVDELAEQPKSGRALVHNVFERELADVDRRGWLKDLNDALARGMYTPGSLSLVGAPKGGGLIRPAARMSLADRVVYTAAVGACLPQIVASIGWSQRTVDFAPLLHHTKWGKRDWLLKPFLGWSAWTERTLDLFDAKKTRLVVTVDVAGFFENVSLPRLQSELARMNCPPESTQLLSGCLNKWAAIEHRGLPQGVLASDILSKIYMESFDKRIKDAGLSHVRYSDDIRIFCRTHADASAALVLATELLRERGLTVQSAKTGIRAATPELRRDFEGALPAIRDLNRDFINEAIDAGLLPFERASVPVSVIDDLVNADPDQMDPEVLLRAWQKFVLDVAEPNQSILRYLLRRFAATGDPTAVPFCAPRLQTYPQQNAEVLRYFESVASRQLERPVADALKSMELRPYPYARYQLLDWLLRTRDRLYRPTLAVVRDHAFGTSHPDYVQDQARAVLGRLGEDSDLDALAALIPDTTDPLRRAQLVCMLARLERSRRNTIAARVRSEVPWGGRAWSYVRT